MTYDNAQHDIERGSVWINKKTGEQVTVTKYDRIDSSRGDVRITGRQCGIELRTFHQEYRRA